MFSIFHIEGGIGKNILATAVVSSLKAADPERKIVVVSAWPQVWFNNPDVYQVFPFGQLANFYKIYIQNQNVSNTLGYNLTARYFNIVFIKTGSTTGSVSVNSINIPMSISGGGLSSMPNINEDLRIGTFRQSGFELHGNIGQVKIYNRALSAQEILQNFNATRFRYGI